MPHTLLHWSDLHIGRGHTEKRRLRRLVLHTLDNYDPATTAIVITGDLTDDGTSEQYAAVLDELWPLRRGFLVEIQPGNHDFKLAGNYPMGDEVDAFWSFRHQLTGATRSIGYPYVNQFGGVQIIGLDSCTEALDVDMLARGKLGYAQLQQLAGYLEMGQRAGLHNVVCLHHHPFDRGIALDLVDSDELLATLSHRCDLLLFGHKHEWDAWSGLYGVGRMLAADKTTTSMRYREIDCETLRVRVVSVG